MLKPEFSVRRLGDRYDRAEVDAFVDRVIATVERRSVGPNVTVDDLRNAAFRTPLLGAGYAANEVDDFLTEAERWLPDRPVAGPSGAVKGERTAPLFTPVRLREGYAPYEVDEFLDRLMATVNGLPVKRPVTVREIRHVQFTPVRLTEGYDVAEVDAFLDTAEEWLS
ncbi:DivIVA domain-containing protein [Kribbella sp. VKM Ac-2571]|uniref:DivIVA domain-containing protein n=1 Tax=Kribbella sp. VKM Ac-2571 TaxID=2512222 RepID=UPI00105CA319|nr:DivIVA domain-containing protein [Kribbella sp. VKM Ac-2571]TDO54038.1 DivIVA domain-containing protein [Kribbella sp. VKM Ac-2571]